MAKKKFDQMADAFYSVVIDPRRKQEVMDSRMVQEDHGAIANLSPKFINRTYNCDKFVERFKPGNDEIF